MAAIAAPSFYDRSMQQLHCPGCLETQPMFTFRNPQALLDYILNFREKHAACHLFKNVAKARAAIRWKKLIAMPGQKSRFRRNSNADNQ